MKLNGLTVELNGQDGDIYEIDGAEYAVPTTFVISVEDGGATDFILSISDGESTVFLERFKAGENSLSFVSECLNERGYNDVDAAIVAKCETYAGN